MKNLLRLSGVLGIVVGLLTGAAPASAHLAPTVEVPTPGDGAAAALDLRPLDGPTIAPDAPTPAATPGGAGPLTATEVLGLVLAGLGLVLAGSMLVTRRRHPDEVPL